MINVTIPAMIVYNSARMEIMIEDWWHDAMQVRILVAGRRELGTWWRYDFREGIAPWRLYLNEREGAAIDLTDGRLCQIPAGVVVLLPAGLRFTTRASGVVPHFYIHFDLSGMPPLPTSLLRSPIYLPEATAVRQLIRELSDQVIGDLPRIELQWRMKAIVHDALARFLARIPTDHAGEHPDVVLKYGPIRHALRRIQDSYASPLPNSHLAEMCNLSEDHFIRTFREVMGVTPAKFIVDFRVRIAAQHLAAGDETLQSVAAASGFADRSHLSRAFRQVMGMCPRDYRCQAQSRRPAPDVDSAREPLPFD